MASYNYGRSYDYDRGMSTRGERRSLQDEELDQRLVDANRRMENSSFRCVQILNETVKMATDMSKELEIQGKSLDRTEDNLDKMATKNTREVKSMFGSMVNPFRKPKIPPDPSPKKSSVPSSKSSKGASKPTIQAQVQKKSTGNKAVDRNLDQLEFWSKQLEREAYSSGSLLDEYNDQMECIRVKMDHITATTELFRKGHKHSRGSNTLADKATR